MRSIADNSLGTRDRLLRAAMELFLENGFAATGMADILHRANANSGSFYYFFKSKDDLLAAVLDQYQVMLYPVLLQPIWSKTKDPIKRIFALLGKYRQLIVESGYTYGCPIGRLALEIDAGNADIHGKLAANFEAWSAAIEQCLNEAQDLGIIKTGNARRLSKFVLTVMEGGVMQSRSYRSVKPFDLAVEELREYFKHLVIRRRVRPNTTRQSRKK